MASLLLVLVALAASLFMAWSIGAGSSGSTPFAPAVGANAISVLRAGFFVGILGFAGAVLQGTNVTEAVGRELIHGVAITPLAAAIGLSTAAGLVAIGVFIGYPIATAFTVTGAMVGVGLALGGDPAWAKYRSIGALWLLTPVVGGGLAYGFARLLRHEAIEERHAVPALAALVGAITANIEFVLLGSTGESASIAATAATAVRTPTIWGVEVAGVVATLGIAAGVAFALYRGMVADPVRGQRRFLLALGALVAFSAGGSQVGLAIGPLLPVLDELAVTPPIVAVLVGGGIGLVAGSWTGAPRMIKAIARDYSSLGPRRSIAALIPSFAIAQIAVFYGIPVSFNEIIVSAIIGSGFAGDGSGVSRAKIGYTAIAWVGSFLLAFGISYGGYRVLVGFSG